MAQDLIEKIRAAAQAKGVDPEVAVSIARAESGLDPNAKAKSSTASGLFQILNSTWSGNKGTPGKQFDSDENIRVGTDIISKNVQSLKGFLGRDPSPKEVYAAHYFGATGAQKFLTAAPDTPAKQLFSEKVLAANPNLQGKTAAQISAQLEGKLKIPASNVSRETSVAKKEREPLPPSLPPMAEATPTKAPAATVAMASGKSLPDIKSLPASYQAAFALAALADAQDEEDDRVYNENKSTETEEFFANYKPVNKLASLDLSVTPVMMANGGEVDGEDLTKPSFGNPNIRKQGEAARRLAAMRDVNTLPDPKTYAAVAGALGTRPDQMGFSVLHPKANEIRDVANPAFAAGTALQMAPAVQALGGGKAAKMLSNMAGQELNAALMGERPGTLLDMFTAPAQPKFMFVRARPEAAARHADLQAQGLSPEQIRAQNLTLVDNRGNLIEEISDAPAVLQQKTASVPRNFYEMLKHPELESIYPTYDMPQVMMETTKRKGAPLAMGNYDVQNNMISGRIRDLPEDDARSMVRGTVLHEGQHAIQSAEGFTEGANPGAFIAYVKARQGKYNPDPTVNENVIREMERTYPNLASVADNFTTRLQADKYMKYVVSDPDRYVGETLYRHMPGEVQAELVRVRSNLSPEQLKATPLEVSMQQLGVDPKNILEMNKMGSRPDRYVGDIEYDGYAHGGIVHRADGSPEEGERLTPQQIERLAMESNTPATVNPNIQRQGEAARRLAAMRDVNTLPDPKTYAVVQGLLGTRPDEMGFSVLNPKLDEIKAVAEPAFAAGTALQIAPALQALGLGKLPGVVGGELNRRLLAGESLTPGINTPAPINFIRRPAGGVFPTAKSVEEEPISGLDKSLKSTLDNNLKYVRAPDENKEAAKQFIDTKLRDYFKTKASSVSDPLREALINGRIKIPKDSPLEEQFPQALINASRAGDVTAMREIEKRFDSMMNISNYRLKPAGTGAATDREATEAFKQTILQQMKTNPSVIPDEFLLRLAKKDTSKLSKQEQAAEVAGIRQKLADNPTLFNTVIEPKMTRLLEDRPLENVNPDSLTQFADLYPALVNAPKRQEGIMALQADVPITDVNYMGIPEIFGIGKSDLMEELTKVSPKDLAQMSVPEFYAKAIPSVAKKEAFRENVRTVDKLAKEGKPVPADIGQFGTKEFLPTDSSGMTWREVTDPKASLIQAKFLNNSIGGYAEAGTYGPMDNGINALKNGEVRLFSLYDKNGHAVNNVEFVTPKVANKLPHKANTITQMNGNGVRTGNVVPEQYAEQMLDLVNALNPKDIPLSIKQLFQTNGLIPTQRATGGMIERQPTDNRRYL